MDNFKRLAVIAAAMLVIAGGDLFRALQAPAAASEDQSSNHGTTDDAAFLPEMREPQQLDLIAESAPKKLHIAFCTS